VPTTFNILGPLLNPANASHFLLGVLDESILMLMAETLLKLGAERSVIVHGYGLDEISCVGPARIIEIDPTGMKTSLIDPEDFGLPRCRITDLRGGDAATNAQILLEMFSGKRGAIADTLILNAAVALWLYGTYPSIADALPYAKENLYNGSALTLLKNWIEFSHD
jgi:anthranilate phosphoribosyltransferase